MSSLYSVGQMNQLGDALEKAGFSVDDITKLRQYPYLGVIKSVLYGHSEIKMIEHIVDLDAQPFIPKGLELHSHKKGGQFKYNPSKIKLYLHEFQKNGGRIEGNKLQKELENIPCYNANLLDFWLAHKELIPEQFKEKTDGYITYIFFFDTVYRDSRGLLYVRCLFWHGGGWNSSYNWLGYGWYRDGAVAVPAS